MSFSFEIHEFLIWCSSPEHVFNLYFKAYYLLTTNYICVFAFAPLRFFLVISLLKRLFFLLFSFICNLWYVALLLVSFTSFSLFYVLLLIYSLIHPIIYLFIHPFLLLLSSVHFSFICVIIYLSIYLFVSLLCLDIFFYVQYLYINFLGDMKNWHSLLLIYHYNVLLSRLLVFQTG